MSSKSSVVKQSFTNSTIVALSSIVLIVIAIIVFIIVFISSSNQSSLQNCNAGQCVTNIFSGTTYCTTLQFDPSFQVCNTQNTCDNTRTPCVYQDQSVGTICPGDPNYTGICDPNLGSCSCINRVYCPDFATAYFVPTTLSESGFTNSGTTTDITVFVSKDTWTDDANFTRADLPLSTGLFGTSSGVCGLGESVLNQVWPPFGTTTSSSNETCITGTLILNETDGLYYCAIFPLTCSTTTFPTRLKDGTFVCH
jgi:hypothetical protein